MILLRLSRVYFFLESFKSCFLLCYVKPDQVNYVIALCMCIDIYWLLQSVVEELMERISKKKAQIACMMENTSEVRRMKDELQQTLSLVSWNFDIYSFWKRYRTSGLLKLYYVNYKHD